MGNKADYIVRGEIYTADSKCRKAEAFAVKDGRYIAVGTEEEVKKYKGLRTKIIDANFAMPGGIEAHGHFLIAGAMKLGLYLNPRREDYSLKNPEEILDDVVAYKNENPGIDKIFGYGWTVHMLGDELALPNIDSREELKDIPVYLAESSLHGGWCNRKCLEIAGISKDTLPKNIKRFLTDSDGNPNGILLDEACSYVRNNVFGALSDMDGYKTAIRNTSKYMNSLGYTAHYDMWTNYDGSDMLFKALKEYSDEKDVSCLYAGAYAFDSYELNESNLSKEILKVAEIKSKYESKNFKPYFIKLFKDGVIESLTGYLSNPYFGKEEYGYGNNYWNADFMNEIVKRANDVGLLVHVHTYGDQAIKETIDSFIYANEKCGYHRNSLGHVSYIDEADYYRIADNDIACAVNANWSTPYSPKYNAYLDSMLGINGSDDIYPAEEFAEHGIKAAISTDYPCGTSAGNSLFDYIGILVTGQDYALGEPAYPAKHDKHCSIEQALDMATINGAWMANLESERGSIEVGKYADFIITDKSPFAIDSKEIHSINIEKLFFEGKEAL